MNNGGLTVTVNNIAPNTNVFLDGNISGTGGLVKNGGGLLWISGANTFTGGTTLNTGGIRINGNNVFGPINSDITINGGSIDAVTNSRSLINYDWIINASFAFLGTRNLTMGSGTFTLNTNATIDIQQRTLTLPAPASGAFSIIQTSTINTNSPTMVLSGNNTYTGTYTVSNGLLKLGSGTALGPVGSGTTVASGAALDLNGQNYALAEPLTISGTGISSGGAIFNSSATAATYAGLVTLAAASSIVASTGDISLSNTGNITGSFGLTLDGSANTSIASNITTGTGTLTKTGTGTATLSGTSNFTGATSVTAGRLHVTGSSTNSTITVSSGATLSGTGTVAAIVNNGGTVQPGSSSTLGILTGNSSANFSGGTNSTLAVRINGFTTAGTDYDRLKISGALTLGGSSVVNIDLSNLSATGTATGIVQMGSRTGTFPTVNVTNQGLYSVCLVYNATSIDAVISLGFLWLKANSNVTGTSTVTAWGDQSCNGYGVSQGTSANSPSLVQNDFNYNPGVKFDGTNDYMTRSTGLFLAATLNNVNTYAVFRTDVQKDQSLFWESLSGGAPNNRFNLYSPLSDNSIYYDAGNISTGNRVSGAWGGTYGKYNVWALHSTTGASSPSGQKQAIYRDGLLLYTNGTTSSFAGNNQAFSVGRQESTANNYFNGSLAELAVFNNSISATQHEAFQSYLAIKYGLTLDQTSLHDYYASDGTSVVYPTSSDATYNSYKYGIAGIARDDLFSQNQKQSSSYNTGDIVTMALGSIAATNAANSNTFSADKSFEMWGNDNGNLMALGQTDFDHSVLQGRIGRIWHVKETGTVNTVRIQADFSSFLGPNAVAGTNDLANTRLLVDADGIFVTGATTISPTSYNNATSLAQFDVDFTAGIGYYFTFGSTDLSLTPLPISLLDYEAYITNEGVKVVWQTTTHRNSSHFLVLRSQDGSTWEDIGSIPSIPNSDAINNYAFLDDQYLPGINYYRVIEVSEDGKNSELGVRMVNAPKQASQVDWSIVPNPNNGHFAIRVHTDFPSRYYLEISDILGRVLYTLSIANGKSDIELDNLPSGSYLAKLKGNGLSETKKILVY
jgi:autotransporter-associated beta strand protein